MNKLTQQKGSVAMIAGAVLGVVVVIGAVGYEVSRHHTHVTTKPTGTVNAAHSSSATQTSGTDNTSLQNDLNGINASSTKENDDQNSANTALNDQQNQVAVPTQ